ncbi:MAG: tetratricopeptide repeat protein [Candidatus Sumerlaeaceae bacterium]|nr:tetratricopeptide repeat protein [Candidatus Sumerlaeaceae bacterium]
MQITAAPVDGPVVPENRSRETKAALLIFLVALTVRAAYLGEMAAKPFWGSLIFDSRYLWQQSESLLTQYAFPTGPFFRPPLYLIWIAFWRLLAGDAALFVIPAVQHVLGAGMSVIVFFMTMRCSGLPGGFVAGLLAAFYAPAIFYEGEVLSDSLGLFLNTAFLAMWLRALDTRVARDFALAGLLAGLAAITRPNIVLVLGLFVPVLLLGGIRQQSQWPLRRRAVLASVFLLPVLILTGLPTMRNTLLGEPAFIGTQGGINFFIGNNIQANGTNIIIPNEVEAAGTEYKDMVEEYAVIGYLQNKHGRQEGLRRYLAGDIAVPGPSKLSAYWYAEARKSLMSHPRAALELYLRKVVAAFNNWEVRNNKDFQFYADYVSSVLHYNPFTFSLLFGLAAIGVAVCLGGGIPHGYWILLYQAVISASVILYFVGGRLRLPIVTGLFVLGGVAWQWVWQRRMQKIDLKGMGAAVLMLVAATGSLSSWSNLDYRTGMGQEDLKGIWNTSNYPLEFSLLAIQAQDANDPRDALEFAMNSIAGAPGSYYPHVLAGNAAVKLGNLRLAAEMFRRAIELEPDSVRAYSNLGVVMEKRGDFQSAAELYELAISKSPFYPVALGNLAILKARAGDKDGARHLAERALKADPKLSTARCVLAWLADPNGQGLSEAERATFEEVTTPLPKPVEFGQPREINKLLDDIAPVQGGAKPAAATP